MNKHQEIYQFRKEDFIPIVGLLRHHTRCVESYKLYNNSAKKDFFDNSFTRDFILLLYNIAIPLGTALGTSKLVDLLSK